jgi:excisionase family DNA binding protein
MTLTSPHAQAEPLWTADDVGRYLKASRSWVYQKAEAGLLPCLRIGGLLRFDPAVVQAWARGEINGAAVLPMRKNTP